MTFASVATANSPPHTQLALPLSSSWTFWYLIRHGRGAAATANYESNLHTLGTFSTAEEFWAIYGHLKRPREMPINSECQAFRSGIRPAWEDDANANGGKWILRMKKGISSRLWEHLLLAICAGLLDEYGVCGVIISVRFSEDIISIWNRNASDEEEKGRLREQLRMVLCLPPSVSLEYKAHDTASNKQHNNADKQSRS